MKILEILSEAPGDLAAAKSKLAQLQAELKEFPSTTSSAEHAEAIEEINYKIKDQEKKIAKLEGKKPVNECTDYKEWREECKKADPDTTFTGTSQGAQAVNWNTKNNRVVGDWDGKKGTVSTITESADVSFPRRVENFINQNFYVYDWKHADSDEFIDYTIEEAKAQYRINANAQGVVGVSADVGTGARFIRAREIKKTLEAL